MHWLERYNNKLNPYGFKISEAEALEIANRNENLKSDFCRNSRRKYITYLRFDQTEIGIVKLEGKKYWQIQILDGDISGIDYKDEEECFWDGFFGKDDLRKLRCLIDVGTGEYIYYPKSKWRLW